jgi:hypothetical protein
LLLSSCPKTVEKRLQQATTENPKLLGCGKLDALCEDFVLVPFDLLQKTVVDVNEQPTARAASAEIRGRSVIPDL